MDRALADFHADSTPSRLEAVMRQLRENVPLVPPMYGSTSVASSFRVSNLRASLVGMLDFAMVDLAD